MISHAPCFGRKAVAGSLLIAATALLSAATVRADEGEVLFEKKIRPILADKCVKCHSAETNKAKGGLRLDTRVALRKGGETGPAINLAAPKKSLILKAMRHDGLEMPPGERLPASVVADFERWITLGAPDPRASNAVSTAPKAKEKEPPLWSLLPVRKPNLPRLAATKDITPIDAFLLERIRNAGLKPSGEADRETLLRRTSFVLTGLPPTPAEQKAFLEDSSPTAFEKVVDRLLASPHFGEHWARHWMDLVNYSETHGYEHDPYLPNAWRYRDYLIRAFNADVPYDRFIREHIAGDRMSPRWNRKLGINEAPAGTAFFRFVDLFPTPVDPKLEEMNVIESQIDTFGKTFQGMTLACARCHDHKFDPISAQDYHRLFGVFSSSRTTMHHLDEPTRLHGFDAELRATKEALRESLAREWLADLDRFAVEARRWPAEKSSAKVTSARKAAIDADASHPLAPLGAWLRNPPGDEKARVSLWAGWKTEQDRRHSRNAGSFRVFADFASDESKGWFAQGEAFSEASSAGDFAIAPTGENAITGVYPRGRFSFLVSDKHPGAWRSPNFTINMNYISVLVAGTKDARVRLVVDNFHGDELLFATVMPKVSRSDLHWATLPIRTQYWKGRTAYLEFIPRDDMVYPSRVPDVSKLPTDGRSGIGVCQVVFHDQPGAPARLSPFAADAWSEAKTFAELVDRWTMSARRAVDSWRKNACSDDDARVVDGLLRAGVLVNRARSEHAKGQLEIYRKTEASIPVPQRIPGLIDEQAFNVPIYVRGNPSLAKEMVPRGYIDVVHAQAFALKSNESGREKLADLVASRDNPLTARVFVNRLWRHVMGEGIVRSVDNFGRLGETPSHPELLDWLADDFVSQGWSIKRAIRQLVLTDAFRRDSRSSAEARAKDPDNRLWSHASLRRLTAESIRDSMLQASGRLDRTPFGLSIPIPSAPWRDFYVPAAGPLDGAGRRSIYLEIRRNFPYAFLTTFDWPRPIATTGQRSETNVPAQSLAMMNDPFVRQQAEVFAKNVLAENSGSDAVESMYRRAFGRSPSSGEIERALAFVTEQAKSLGGVAQTDVRPWRELAHAMFNMKEFLFVR